jgi:hypothetical protein
MENSRHEKAALVTTAYIIGAITAFIWFGLAQTDRSNLDLYQYQIPTQAAAVAMAVDRVVLAPASEQAASLVNYNNGLLEVSVNSETRVLSYNPDTTGFAAEKDFLMQGLHYGEIIYSSSQSGEYVFFCEPKSVTADFCSAFVFDTILDVIHPLTRYSQASELTLEMAKSVVWNGNTLNFGTFQSINAITPWVMN